MYLLRATEDDGIKSFYVNLACVSEQMQTAKKYETIEDAKKDIENFKNLFYGNPKIEIVQRYETKQPFLTVNAGE